MTYKERQSCIHTIQTLRSLALDIHGAIDEVDNSNCNELIRLLEGGIDEIYRAHYRQGIRDAVENPEAVFDFD